MNNKTLKDLNNIELEYLLDFIKDKNVETKNKKNYIIINGPFYFDNINNKKYSFDRIRFENKDKNTIKMIYNLNNYQSYNLDKSPELEYNIEINKIIDLNLNYIYESINYYYLLIRVYMKF